MIKFVTLKDFQIQAKKKLPKMVYDYYRSGADDQITLKRNRSDFDKIKLIPRVLKDVSRIDTSVKILGHTMDSPIIIAPTAMQKLAHPLGEIATARAASEVKMTAGLSTASTTRLEDFSKEMTDSHAWFQLYVTKDRNITRQLVDRAEKAGFKALLVTVDAPVLGNRISDHKNHFKLPKHLDLVNLHGLTGMEGEAEGSSLSAFFANQFDPSLQWQDITWLRNITKLPIIVKGIAHPEDAKLAMKHGAHGIIVSNHGGRQLDSAISTIEALPGIVHVVRPLNKDFPILMDGGIRRGTDILKAIALGANGILIGRPILWGLAVNGKNGIVDVVSILKKEFIRSMILTGCRSIDEISRELIWTLQDEK